MGYRIRLEENCVLNIYLLRSLIIEHTPRCCSRLFPSPLSHVMVFPVFFSVPLSLDFFRAFLATEVSAPIGEFHAWDWLWYPLTCSPRVGVYRCAWISPGFELRISHLAVQPATARPPLKYSLIIIIVLSPEIDVFSWDIRNYTRKLCCSGVGGQCPRKCASESLYAYRPTERGSYKGGKVSIGAQNPWQMSKCPKRANVQNF